ncbi:hypothetical protein A2U01_0072610, partial [Trifolium medium]|nr:hypothetical protein [Trifolium medium]
MELLPKKFEKVCHSTRRHMRHFSLCAVLAHGGIETHAMSVRMAEMGVSPCTREGGKGSDT